MKKKNNLRTWILISTSFLFLIVCISFYIQNKGVTKPNEQSITLTDVGFDTPITFQAICSQKEFTQYVQIVKETYAKYNALFDQYNAYENINNVYTLNTKAKDQVIKVDNELIDCIQKAKEVHSLSPQFDITQGAVLTLWHDAREASQDLKDGILPEQGLLQEASLHTGFDKLKILDNTIHYLDPELQLDLGGIAKGYATQKCKENLVQAGLKQGFINAGGNVVLIGEKNDGWKVGIQDPDQNTSIVRLTIPSEKAIVTSGDYQRYFTAQGKRYSHIIDPITLYPSNYVRSVTILTSDSTLADGLSTALFNMSYEDGNKLVKNLKKQYEIDVVWILDKENKIRSDIKNEDYIIKYTNGLEGAIEIAN